MTLALAPTGQHAANGGGLRRAVARGEAGGTSWLGHVRALPASMCHRIPAYYSVGHKESAFINADSGLAVWSPHWHARFPVAGTVVLIAAVRRARAQPIIAATKWCVLSYHAAHSNFMTPKLKDTPSEGIVGYPIL